MKDLMAWILTNLKKFAKKVQELISGRSLENEIEAENNQKELKSQHFKLKELNLKSMFNKSMFNQNLFALAIKNKWFMAMLIYAFRKRLLKLRYYLAFLAWLKRKKIRRAFQNKMEELENEAFENKTFESKFEKLSESQKNPKLFAKQLHHLLNNQDLIPNRDLPLNKKELLLNKAVENPELFFNFIKRQISKESAENSENVTETSNDSLGVRKNLGETPHSFRKSSNP